MFLHSISVENYRAIQKGQLTLDKSIAIIGENNSGKSSLLDALSKILETSYIDNDFEPGIRHFYHKNKESKDFKPIKIEVEFEEKNAGEWQDQKFHPIHKLLDRSGKFSHKLILQLKVYYASDSCTLNWILYCPSTNKRTSDKEIINWLRQLNPVILLSAGMLTGHGINNLAIKPQRNTENSFPDNLQKHVLNVLECSELLLSGNSIHISTDLDKGYQSALKLSEYLTQLQASESIKLSFPRFGNTKTEPTNRRVPVSKTGSSSEKLGTLLVMNALIQACGSTKLTEVDPIWIIEDPEAHLHKITLASVSNIVEGINGQKIITTNSGGLLANIPLHQVRRLMRNNGVISEHFVEKNALSKNDIRRVNYHVRTHRNSAFFSRVWLLVEGETEFWILPRLARVLGYDFRLEGITCVEYAQSGLKPLIRIAEQLNIKWLMLSDGDHAGHKYANQARNYVSNVSDKQICVFPAKDIEHYLWENGFDHVYIRQSRTRLPREKINASRTIKSAIRNYSKPHLALSIIDAASGENATPVPEGLIELIENCVLTAREVFK